MTTPSASVVAARQGREALATALLSLQTTGILEGSLERAVEATAAASSALYSAEAEATTEEGAISFVHGAAESLHRAMAELNALRLRYPKIEPGAVSIARTLALLYPVLQHSMRQRRARLPAGGLSDADVRELRAMAGFPPAPERAGRSQRPSGFEGVERRKARAQRVCIEVEIGLTSESHIYTGISLDVSTGGVFVATYEPAAPGTAISLYFVLPDGHVVNADGTVRWTRAATTDAPPGMGVAFVNISNESLAHIARFCESRPPLYFDD